MASEVATWQIIVGGLFAVGIVFWMWPAVKRQQQQGRKGEKKEWMNVVFILGMVVLFVSVLILMAQG